MSGLKKMVFISSDFILTYRFRYHPYDGSVDEEAICNAGDPDSILGLGRSTGEGIGYLVQYSWASPLAQLVKNSPAMWETWV